MEGDRIVGLKISTAIFIHFHLHLFCATLRSSLYIRRSPRLSPNVKTSIRSGIIDDIDFLNLNLHANAIRFHLHATVREQQQHFHKMTFQWIFHLRRFDLCESRIFDVCVFGTTVLFLASSGFDFELWCRFSRPIHHPNIYLKIDFHQNVMGAA